MHKIYKLVLVLLLALFVFNINSNNVGADKVLPEVVISQVQAGGTEENVFGKAATQEFIAIYNNGLTDIDISDWCIINKTNKPVICFDDHAENVSLHLPAHKYITIATNSFVSQYQTDYPLFDVDYIFEPSSASNGSIIASSDSLTLVDIDIEPVDNVKWAIVGDSTSFPSSVAGGSSLLRRNDLIIIDKYVDTNNSANDYAKVSRPVAPVGGSIYEVEIPDVCMNIEGIQTVLPDEYTVDEKGFCLPPLVDQCLNIEGMQAEIPEGSYDDGTKNCYEDVCKNLDGLQIMIPDGKELNADLGCIDIDECSNLPDNQLAIPGGYYRGDNNSCLLNILPIHVTELMPNAVGSDDGNEFIELYNPNDSEVSLSYYEFYVGSDEVHPFAFPTGSVIAANQYIKFFNNEIKFILVNTTSRIKLKLIDNSYVEEVPAYNNPVDGQSWALINGVWQYTNRPTPGSANLPSLIEEMLDDNILEAANLVPCAANQYRNPETNRCRLIVAVAPDLVPCKDGQYRSEETNRCRNIITDVVDLVPCAEGQERNPLTNRCRSISSVLGASDLVPCKVGQERNPETNRCRNIVSMPKADYAPEKTNVDNNNDGMWLLLAGVGGLAFGYAIWEWRRELAKAAIKIKSILRFKK